MAERSERLPIAAYALAGLLILIQSALLTWCALDDSPTLMEPYYLHGGLACWVTGRTDQMPQNPPLPQMLLSLPVYLGDGDVATDSVVSTLVPSAAVDRPVKTARPSGPNAFLRRIGLRILPWVHRARAVAIIGCLAAGMLLWLVMSLGAGRRAGLWSVLLWTLSTTVIAYGHVATADTLAAFGTTTLIGAYLLCLRRPGAAASFALGASQALAVGLKLTLLALVPLSVLWSVLSCMLSATHHLTRRMASAALAWTLSFWVSVTLVFLPSLPLAVEEPAWQPESGLLQELFRFAPSRAALRWLPGALVKGVDLQATRSLEDPQPCRLWGRNYELAPPYYYLVAFSAKETVGVLALLVLGIGSGITGLLRGRASDVCVVGLTGALVFLLAISMLRGVVQYRYLVPAVPFLIAAAAPGLAELGSGRVRVLPRALAVAAVVEVAWIAPFFLAAGNILVGGPMGITKVLGDDAVDWGQDLYRVRRWIESHPEYRVVSISLPHVIAPELLGIVSELPAPQHSALEGFAGRRSVFIVSVRAIGQYPFSLAISQPSGNEDLLRWVQTADPEQPLARITPAVWAFPAPEPTDPQRPIRRD